MSLLSLASAGCRQLVSAVDGVAALLSLGLRLNNALAAQLVSLLAAVASGVLLLLDRFAAALRILLTDLAAFVADVGDGVSAVVDLTTSAVTEVFLAAGRVLTALGDGVGEVAAAVLGLCRAVAVALTTVWAAVTGLVVTGVRSVVLMYQTVIYLLTMVPYSIVFCVVRCFTLLEQSLKGVVFWCVSGCGAAADGVRRAVVGALDGVRCVPPAALLGAALLLLAVLGLRRLVRLVSARGLPVEQLQTAAARLLAVCRRASVSLGARVWRRARPAVDQLVDALDRSARGASDGLRAAVALCRLSVAVMFAAVYIVSRCVRVFVQNVMLGLRLGAAAGQRAPALLQEPEPREPPQPREPPEREPRDWGLEQGTPPPRAAPRRRLRDKTAAGCSPSARGAAGDTSRVCVVCLDQDKSVILLPCRHVCLCEPCGRTVGAGDRRCPMCREYIQDALKVYL